MDSKSNSNGNNQTVVYRLRVTFAVIILTTGLFALIGSTLLFELKKAHKNSIEKALPTLAQSHEMESLLVSINELIVKLRNESNVYEVQQIHTALLVQKNHLHSSLEANFPEFDDDNPELTALRESIRYLASSVEGVVNAKLQMIELTESTEAKLARVRDIRTAFSEIIDPLSLTLATSMNDSLNSISENTAASSLTRASLGNNFNDQYQLLEISSSFSALVDIIEHLPNASIGQNQKNIFLNIKFRFQNITQILINFTDTDMRRKLAIIIKELRVMTLGDNGLMGNLTAYQDNATHFTTSHDRQLAEVNAVSEMIDKLVVKTKQEVESTIINFNTTLNNIVLSEAIFAIGVLAIIALVNFSVVERQINRRMQKLTSAVLDIAGGDHNREVNISGLDEIATMANALEVFKENARELERSNNELEQFAYAASHDLKSPLRAIESLAQWTLEDAGDELAPEAKTNLQQLLVRANRLSKLQSDLLNYSTVGSSDDSLKIVDFNRVVDDLAMILNPDQRFTIQLIRAPTGLATQLVPLRQILLNLITNAMKHHDRESGSIEITVDIEQGRFSIALSDDGPGIATEYHERIFGLFEKLESRDTVEGSGLGLSLVKKMIERYQSSIAVYSDPTKNRGSTFVFDWPIAEVPVSAPFFEPPKKAVGF